MNCDIPRKWVAVTPHDTNALANGETVVGLYVGGAGVVTTKSKDNASDSAITASAGGYLYGRFSHVRSTGTTATLIHALY